MFSAMIDWLPIICFFIAFKIKGIYFATTVIMISSIAQLIAIKYLLKKKIEVTNYAILALVLITGGLTLVFHNESFIKWKPTILYSAFAIAFLITPLIKKVGLAEIMLANKIKLEKKAWKIVNHIFITFFLIMGLLNTYVIMNFSTATWVNYKLFGTLILTLMFVLILSLYLIKNKVED